MPPCYAVMLSTENGNTWKNKSVAFRNSTAIIGPVITPFNNVSIS